MCVKGTFMETNKLMNVELQIRYR